MTNKLFEPLKIGGVELPNRMIMAPMTRGRAGESRIPNELMATYYKQRSGAGLLITEATAVSEDGYGWVGAPAIYNEEQQQGWKLVTRSVHEAGGRIFLQLWHMGRVSHPDFLNGDLPVGPSAIAAEGEAHTPNGSKPYVVPRELGKNDLSTILDNYAAATGRALDAGFDGVEVHSANGYLLDQFLRDGSNQRADEYGGSIGNRLRFPLEVVDTIIKVASKERVGVRISPVNPYNDMRDSDPQALFTAYAKELSQRNIAYLHVLEALPGHFLHAEGNATLPAIRSSFDGIVIANGGYDKTTGHQLLADGSADAVAFGVPFLANPDLVDRFKQDGELNMPDMDTFYTSGAEGYTDYPLLNS